MSCNLFIQINKNDILTGDGISRAADFPSNELPSFYAPDFFLTNTTPWFIPESTRTLPFSELMTQAQIQKPDPLEWKPVGDRAFEKSFKKAKQLIQSKTVKKIVPVFFESSTKIDGVTDHLHHFLSRMNHSLHSHLYLYGGSFNDDGIIGLTPEILFELKGDSLLTSALAGTTKSSTKELLYNSKDQDEHALVVEDIVEKLERFGSISIAETVIHEVGSIAHLKTPIEVKLNRQCQFQDIIDALHPTAALGAFPSNKESWNFFQGEDQLYQRNRFGAPFGVRYPNGEGFCLVAIRGIQWTKSSYTIGAGAGIVRESVYEKELEEIMLKLATVKGIFNI